MEGVFMESQTERSVGYLTRHGPDLHLDDVLSIWWAADADNELITFIYRGIAHGIPDNIRSQQVVKIADGGVDLSTDVRIPRSRFHVFIKPSNPENFRQHIKRWNDISDMEEHYATVFE